MFPPIGQLPYLLTLPPYAFYWFILATETAMPAWHVPAPEPLPELVTLVLRNGIGEVLEPEQTRGHRAGDSAALSRAAALVRGEGPQASARSASPAPMRSAGAPGDFMLVEIEVDDGRRHRRYLMPLGIVWEDEKPPAIAAAAGAGARAPAPADRLSDRRFCRRRAAARGAWRACATGSPGAAAGRRTALARDQLATIPIRAGRSWRSAGCRRSSPTAR